MGTISTRCAALGCCERRANTVFEFCHRHARELNSLDRWLRGCLPIVEDGGVLRVKPGDSQSSFDVARAQWAQASAAIKARDRHP